MKEEELEQLLLKNIAIENALKKYWYCYIVRDQALKELKKNPHDRPALVKYNEAHSTWTNLGDKLGESIKNGD